jgi:hypothetical protein
MKQASFLINSKDNIIKKDEDLKENNDIIKTKDEDTNDKITFNLTSDHSIKNITSKKPQKLVENIYYFR